MAKIEVKITDENEDWLQAARKEDEDKKKEASIGQKVLARHEKRTAAVRSPKSPRKP